jgi:hypothetical protein
LLGEAWLEQAYLEQAGLEEPFLEQGVLEISQDLVELVLCLSRVWYPL